MRTDYFSVLNEPRRPWIDAEALKRKFLAFSAESHPDRVHSASQQEKEPAHQRYLEIHAAYNCLRDPKTRLRHLLDLERGTKPPDVQTVPPGLLELFMEVGRVSCAVDAFLAERARTTSPLLRAQLFVQAAEHEREISGLHKGITSLRESLEAELKTVNDAWDSSADRGALLSRLEEMYRLFSYFSGWLGQLSERQFQLLDKA